MLQGTREHSVSVRRLMKMEIEEQARSLLPPGSYYMISPRSYKIRNKLKHPCLSYLIWGGLRCCLVLTVKSSFRILMKSLGVLRGGGALDRLQTLKRGSFSLCDSGAVYKNSRTSRCWFSAYLVNL